MATNIPTAADRFSPNPSKSIGLEQFVKPALIGFTILYLGLILFIPALNVFVQAFSGGIDGFLQTFSDRAFLNAVKLTALMAIVAIPVNTVFGLCAAWAIARNKRFPGRALLISIIDLPFSVSPVVAGLMLVLLYGRNGWLGPFLESHDWKIIFAVPGMVLATSFVSMPFVAREVLPVLEEIGTDQEEAAKNSGRIRLADLLAGDFTLHSLGLAVWHYFDERARHGRVWRGRRRIGQHHRQNPNPAAVRRRNLQAIPHATGLCRRRAACLLGDCHDGCQSDSRAQNGRRHSQGRALRGSCGDRPLEIRVCPSLQFNPTQYPEGVSPIHLIFL